MTQTHKLDLLLKEVEEIRKSLPKDVGTLTDAEILELVKQGKPLPTRGPSVEDKLDSIEKEVKMLSFLAKPVFTFAVVFTLLFGATYVLSFKGCDKFPNKDQTVVIKTFGDKIFAEAVKKKPQGQTGIEKEEV